MPLNIELRDEVGAVESQITGDTAVLGIVEALGEASQGLLRFVDPYGDTMFNRLQAPAFADELRALAEGLTDVAQRDREAIAAVAALADRCAASVHTYLWLIGD